MLQAGYIFGEKQIFDFNIKIIFEMQGSKNSRGYIDYYSMLKTELETNMSTQVCVLFNLLYYSIV